MATLDSSSTLVQIQAAYDDNASYRLDQSIAKAELFALACKLLLRRTPASASHGAGSVSMDVGQIRRELDDAVRWAEEQRRRAVGGARQLTFEEFRR